MQWRFQGNEDSVKFKLAVSPGQKLQMGTLAEAG